MARKFMYACFGLLALTVAYHLGASSVQSQTGEFVGISVTDYNGQFGAFLLTANGDCYWGNVGVTPAYWVYKGNPLGGVSTQSSTWGQIKAQFKD